MGSLSPSVTNSGDPALGLWSLQVTLLCKARLAVPGGTISTGGRFVSLGGSICSVNSKSGGVPLKAGLGRTISKGTNGLSVAGAASEDHGSGVDNRGGVGNRGNGGNRWGNRGRRGAGG